MPFKLALSGPDPYIKTTLLSLFPRDWPLVHYGGIQKYDAGPIGLTAGNPVEGVIYGNREKDGAATNEQFIREVHSACNARYEFAHDDSKSNGCSGNLFDSSALIYEAVCIARIAYTDGSTVTNAQGKFYRLLDKMQLCFPLEDIRIILVRAGEIEDGVNWNLFGKVPSQEVKATEAYSTYQELLHEAIFEQIKSKRHSALVKIEPEETFLTTLGKIIEVINESPFRNTDRFWPILRHLDCVVAFGGLSECGKSTVAKATTKEAFAVTSGGAFRLKIGYLLDSASARLDKNIYDLSEDQQAIELVHELDRFSNAHRWLRFITLESLHNFTSTMYLRELIGAAALGVPHPDATGQLPPKYIVVYLDTPLHLRIQRTELQGKVFDPDKDVSKSSRGADKIRDIADIVVSNEGDFDNTCCEVMAGVDRLIPDWRD